MSPKSGAAGELNGFLDAGSRIEGELTFEDTFRIDGNLTGKALSKGDLIVGEGGEVSGEVHVGRLFVSGTVKGTVQATSRIEVAAGARLEADVTTATLLIEEGAWFQGRCVMDDEVKPAGGAIDPALKRSNEDST